MKKGRTKKNSSPATKAGKATPTKKFPIRREGWSEEEIRVWDRVWEHGEEVLMSPLKEEEKK